jgi:hypothetical protein
VPPILPPQDGFLFLDREELHASFAGDLSPEQDVIVIRTTYPARRASRCLCRPLPRRRIHRV